MPLFSRTTNSQANDGDAHGQQQQRHDRPPPAADDGAAAPPPDEHTRLLPRAGRGMLRPDDPAVTPYNLFSIRILRFLTLLFTGLTFIWWVVVLVTAFATPPGLHTRGSSFYAYGYASLALANMLFTLLFFSVPSKAVRTVAAVMAFLLLLDFIILISVRQTRYEEGCVGIVSVVWALLTSLWTLLSDRAVKWGKEEEEERLTGRAETRRTLAEWLAVLLSTIAYVIMAVAAALISLTIILRALDAGVAPPGAMYAVDGAKYRVHVFCNGSETEAQSRKLPTVLLEGGERPVEDGLWRLADDAVDNGSITRYCFVDRPGIAWSDTAPSPLSAGFAADVLSEALAQAGERGPWVLASAGIGSIYARVFSSRHRSDVRALLLIDPLHEDLLGQVAAPGRGLLLWLRGAISPLGLDRLSGAIFRGRTSRDRLYGRAVQQGSKFIFAKLQENLVAASFTQRDVQGSRQIQDKATPLVVISSGIRVKESETWGKKQRDLTKLTDNLKHWDVVDEAPHQVWETTPGREQIERRLRQLVHA